jgi:hypothetical protein
VTAKRSSTVSSHADEVIAQESERGFRGVEVDPTPNENYTVAGVTSGAPTPETDVTTAKEARDVTGLGLTGLEFQEKAKAGEEARRGNKK